MKRETVLRVLNRGDPIRRGKGQARKDSESCDHDNGFAPWHTDFEYDEFSPDWMNWIRQNLYYSDGFSYQDAFVWDLMGALIGTGIATLIL